jgi:hypothetical protein
MTFWQARLLDAGLVLLLAGTAYLWIDPAAGIPRLVPFVVCWTVALGYIAHLVWVNPRPQNQHWAWAFGLMLLTPLAVPVYWLLYLAPEGFPTRR